MTTEDKFLAAVEVINSIPYDGTFEPSDEMMLRLYAYQKQACEGPCNIPKPYVWNVSSRAKWNAWHDLGSTSREVAMECYIEELTKVIETMSYNEKISKFMSLMGPFYEVVSSDETDSQKEKRKYEEKSVSATVLENYHPPTVSELYNMPRNVEKERNLHLDSNKVEMLENFRFSETISRNFSQSSSSSSSGISNFDLLSDLSGAESSPPSESDMLSIFKKKEFFKDCPFLTEKDLLVLTIINLQTSLEGILAKLDTLHVLAESADLSNIKASRESLQSNSWSLNFTGTAFALLWPVAVELYFQTFRK